LPQSADQHRDPAGEAAGGPKGSAFRKTGAPLLFLTLAFFLTTLLTRSYAIDSDEGYTLNAAWQLWNGMKLYDDFRHFVGPGSAYSVYLLWRVIGSPSLLAARLLALACSFSATTALVLMLRRGGLRGMGLAFSVFAWLAASSLYVPLNHNSLSSFAAVWFLLLFLRLARQTEEGDHPRRLRDQAWVGVAAGIVFLFLQTKGLLLAFGATALAVSVGFKRRDFAPALALAGGFLAVVAPLFLIWSPAVLIRQWLLIPLGGNYLGHTGASGIVAFIAVALVAVMGWIAQRRRDRVLQALAVTQAALVACMSHNMELNHLAINGFPAILFAALQIHRRLSGSRSGSRSENRPILSSELTMAIIAAAFVLTMVVTPTGRSLAASSSFSVNLLGRHSRGTLFSSPRLAEARAIYAGPFLPGLYFQLGKKNPFFVSETVVCNAECQAQLVAQLAVTKPEIVFLNYGMIRHLGYDPNSPVDVYLRQRYVLCHGDNYGSMIVRAADASWCP
jgi:hypothetical protein